MPVYNYDSDAPINKIYDMDADGQLHPIARVYAMDEQGLHLVYTAEERHTLTATATLGWDGADGSVARAVLQLPRGESFRVESVRFDQAIYTHVSVQLTVNGEQTPLYAYDQTVGVQHQIQAGPLPAEGSCTAQTDDTVVLQVKGWASSSSWGSRPTQTVTVEVVSGI